MSLPGRVRAAVIAGLLLMAAPATAQTISLAPSDKVPDFMQLFQPDAPWSHAASHIQVFGLSFRLMSGGSDDALRTIFAGLRTRNIALALDMLPLTGPDSGGTNHCGYQIEGYSAWGQTGVVARRIKALGGQPKYYGMDEPLFYGHYYHGPRACGTSIDAIARDVAAKVQQVRAVFPDVLIGDTEPFMAFPEQTWRTDLAHWLDAYRDATGTQLAFFGLDLDWAASWRQRMPDLIAMLHQRGIQLSVIYNGSGLAKSDAEWVAQATANFKAFETSVPVPPDGVAFISWNPHPTHVLPETDPTTLTGLVDSYIAWKASRH